MSREIATRLRQGGTYAGDPHAKHVFDMTIARAFGAKGMRMLPTMSVGIQKDQCITASAESLSRMAAGSPKESRHAQSKKSYDVSADLVIMAGWLHPIPFRTRP